MRLNGVSRVSFSLFIYLFMSYSFSASSIPKKNVILILTDDLDMVMNSTKALPKSKKLIQDQGVTFLNSYVAAPICCPSRSSILSGLYPHHHHVVNNSLSGGCSNISWQTNFEPFNFNVALQKQGYETFYAGKYLNQYGSETVGGAKHVPPGWDWWAGLVGNSKYYNYTLSVNGTGRRFDDVYLTDVLKNMSLQFLDHISDEPFFMFIAPPAPHEPFTPATRHQNLYVNEKVPVTPTFNYCGNHLKNKHWLMRMEPCPLPRDFINDLNVVYRKRLQTLASVDELVEDIILKLKFMNRLDQTYVIFTSDNGYHIGQFAQAWDKRQPYESDVKVPLFVRGPGLSPGTYSTYPVTNADLASTILDMAGISATKKTDGESFLDFASKSKRVYDRTLLIDYAGESNPEFVSTDCKWNPNGLSHCQQQALCKCQDSTNNSYICLRRISNEVNSKHCFFDDEENFVEIYNLTDDPFELQNTAKQHEQN